MHNTYDERLSFISITIAIPLFFVFRGLLGSLKMLEGNGDLSTK